MELTAHQRSFGIDKNDEPFAFVWMKDDGQNFVFSLLRPLVGNRASLIEFMVVDQLLERVSDFRCRLDDLCIRAEVPAKLRKYTEGSGEITVYHKCSKNTLVKLADVLTRIFEGKTGLEIRIPKKPTISSTSKTEKKRK